MALRVANNVAAINAQRNLNKSQNMLTTSLERLSSGLRINKAADDAAGLSISQSFRADIASFKMASKNASQATAMLQTAEGGLDQIHSMLTRLKELATQAASDNVDGNRSDINAEAAQLKEEINRIAESTEYTGTQLLTGYGEYSEVDTATSGWDDQSNIYDIDVTNADVGTIASGDITYTAASNALEITRGSVTETVVLQTGQEANFEQHNLSFKTTDAVTLDTLGAALAGTNLTIQAAGSTGGKFQVGASNDTNNRLSFTIGSVKTDQIGTAGTKVSTLDLTTRAGAQEAMDVVDAAITDVNGIRSSIGANQNRLSYASANLATSIENATASESVIRDADIANEMTQFTKAQILQQAGTAMLAQANTLPQAALSLLGG